MSATEPVKVTEKLNNQRTERAFKVATSATRIYAGTFVAVNANGEALPASDTAGLKVVGIAGETKDAGEIISVMGGRFEVANDETAPVTAAMIDQPVFVKDDASIAAAGTNSIPAGILREIDIQTGNPVIDVGTLVKNP